MGAQFWGAAFGSINVCFAKSVSWANHSGEIVQLRDDRPAYGVYILTESGRALSSILPSNEENVGIEYARKLQTILPPNEVFLLLPSSGGGFAKIAVPPPA